MTQTKITLENVYKIFGNDVEIALDLLNQGLSKEEILEKTGCSIGVQDISLEIKTGECFVIMGLSGSGKSTLIRHINRLIEPTSGKIWIDGEDVVSMNKKELMNLRRNKVSMVFQKFALLPHKTILENVRYGLDIKGVNKKLATQKAIKQLEMVELIGIEGQYPKQLSGGMQQRVGLARALVTDADILLMDEPFSALDPLIRSQMQQQMIELKKRINKTILFITHDLDEALKIGDTIAIMKDGKLIQVGSPDEIVNNPADDYVGAFVQNINND